VDATLTDPGIVILLLSAGLFTAWAAGKFIRIDSSIVKGALIAAPLLGLPFVRGQPAEIELFEKFRIIVRAAAATPVISIAKAEALALSDEDANKRYYDWAAFWLICQPYLVLMDGETPSPDNEGFKNFVLKVAPLVRASILCGTFKALVVIDKGERPIGYFPHGFLTEIISVADSDYDAILKTELGLIFKAPKGRAGASDGRKLVVKRDTKAIEALERMKSEQVDVAPLTDEQGRFRGIITREALIEAIVLSTAAAFEHK
jgi:hypothetical protein